MKSYTFFSQRKAIVPVALLSAAGGYLLSQYLSFTDPSGKLVKNQSPAPDSQLYLGKSTLISKSTSKSKSKPILPKSPYSTSYPGVYAWGSNSGGVTAPGFESLVTTVKTPYRIPFFDGRLLRDLKMSETVGVAVLDNGDIVQWGTDYFGKSSPSKVSENIPTGYTVDIAPIDPEVTLKGKNIKKVAISNSKAVYGLNLTGTKVYVWPLSKEDVHNGPKLKSEKSWWQIWRFFWRTNENVSYTTLKIPKMGFREYIDDIKIGNDHVLVLTSKGRVFSGSSGLYLHHKPASSKGQFGIAKFSQFDDAPEPGILHEIKTFRNMVVKQIACGDYHSLARTLSGDVYVFGENSLGQLGIPYSYKTAIISVPTLLPLHKLYPRKISPIATNIAAGGSTSFVSVQPKLNALEFYREFPGEEETMSSLIDKDILDQVARNVFAFGEGLKGQLGAGIFVHTQSTPLRLKYFSDLKEYSESLGKMIPIDVSKWTIGKSHAAVIVGGQNGSIGSGEDRKHDVLLWGGNDFWQLGTGKRNSIPSPTRVPSLDAMISPKKLTSSLSSDEKDATQSSVEYIENVDFFNNRLQLIHHQQIKYTDQSGHIHNATVSQDISVGDYNTAIYMKPS